MNILKYKITTVVLSYPSMNTPIRSSIPKKQLPNSCSKTTFVPPKNIILVHLSLRQYSTSRFLVTSLWLPVYLVYIYTIRYLFAFRLSLIAACHIHPPLFL